MDVPFKELLESIGTIALEKLPEGGYNDPDRLQQIDKMLGRFANYYAYLMYLWAHVSNATNTRKLMGDTTGHLDAAKRKETLYELAQAIKMKHESASRMLTVQQVMKENPHEHRVWNKATPFEMGITEALTPRTGKQPGERKAGGGWASVPK